MTSVNALYLPPLAPTWRDVLVVAADALHAPADDAARRVGLDVRRWGLFGREYRSPLFDLVDLRADLDAVEGVKA